MLTDTRKGFGSISIALHWLGAVAIGYLWISGQSIEHSNDATRITHIAMGSGLAVLLLARVIWRAVSVNPSPMSSAPVLNTVASAVKIALLLDIVLAVGTGLLAVWLEGHPVNVFGMFSLGSPFAVASQTARSMRGRGKLKKPITLKPASRASPPATEASMPCR